MFLASFVALLAYASVCAAGSAAATGSAANASGIIDGAFNATFSGSSAAGSSAPAPAPAPPPTWAPCCTPADTLCAVWSSVTFAPAAPQAGDTLVVNASGAMGGPGTVLPTPPLAAGAVDAWHGGSDVFEAAIATCGETQFSVLGLSNVVVDALTCPTALRGGASVVVTFPIPLLAKGLGAFNVTVKGFDNTGAQLAFCVNVLVTV